MYAMGSPKLKLQEAKLLNKTFYTDICILYLYTDL